MKNKNITTRGAWQATDLSRASRDGTDSTDMELGPVFPIRVIRVISGQFFWVAGIAPL
ncbi:MAG: hypothetical protein HYV36_06220 [Lentisphaerae bacterium]|nr:hypothetical protein [Lentisphaerota bacterium]